MSAAFIEAIKERRSIYTLTSESTIPDDKIVEIVSEAVKHTPSSFNAQSSRAVVLFGDEHKKVWQLVLDTLKPIVPADQWGATEGKVNGCFAAGHGTVLFFEDSVPVKKLQDAFPIYADNFPGWSQHSSAILQFIIWTALAKEGLGATLQHYNPLITQQVLSTWGLPDTWSLVAQMPFGKPSAPAGAKEFSPVEERVKVFGK
ncbi:Nitroreductase [Epithele typhae]|uniref:Nitroreductase n=1 Tax=Epithele typhae TaxID=378194 RepID=UPI0020073F06|nr:Nitroreductase [Epithele typhae]KAH9925868.1 Nitroreductase [Epithele typhae]